MTKPLGIHLDLGDTIHEVPIKPFHELTVADYLHITAMKISERRPVCGPHNGTQDSVALPVPSMIKGNGEVRMSWSSHKGADGKDIHSVWFSDEDGALIATHTLGDDDVRPWDKVSFILKKFRKQALALLDKLNTAL